MLFRSRVYIYTHTCFLTPTHSCTQTHIHTQSCTQTHIHTYTYKHIHTHTHAHTHTHILTYIYTHTHLHTLTHTHLHTTVAPDTSIDSTKKISHNQMRKKRTWQVIQHQSQSVQSERTSSRAAMSDFSPSIFS